MKPTHEHDCDNCVYIDTVERDDGPVDVYRCPHNGMPTWVVRHGSDGSEYTSMPEFMLDSVAPEHPLWYIVPLARDYLEHVRVRATWLQASD